MRCAPGSFPRWFPDFAFGYGFPVLNFYSPLGYYLAELFQLVVGDAWSHEAGLRGVPASLRAGHVPVRQTALGGGGGLLASLAYTYAPYHLADVYRRGALAESLAFVWFPLMLWLVPAAGDVPAPGGRCRPAVAGRRRA